MDEKSATPKSTRACRNPNCGERIVWTGSRGQPPKFHSDKCRLDTNKEIRALYKALQAAEKKLTAASGEEKADLFSERKRLGWLLGAYLPEVIDIALGRGRSAKAGPEHPTAVGDTTTRLDPWLESGTQVRHDEWGLGVISHLEVLRGQPVVMVDFESVGSKAIPVEPTMRSIYPVKTFRTAAELLASRTRNGPWHREITVTKGDTIRKLAALYLGGWEQADQLAEVNGLSSDWRLVPGMSLRLPPSGFHE